MDVRRFNRSAWDKLVESGNPWTVPVTSEAIARARAGEWRILLTPSKAVPTSWLGDVRNREVLCLASGGGQQGPILAAAGARVTVFDNSPRQLQQDRMVSQRDGLVLRTVEGTMKDLSAFGDAGFDLVVHPVSNCFVDDVMPVWREAARVLRPGGALLAGFNNPMVYIFDYASLERDGMLHVKHPLPYSDVEVLDSGAMEGQQERGMPLEFSHTFQTLIGGQLEAGLAMVGFYEDRDADGSNPAMNRIFPTFFATRSVKL